jgi:hypothetical protein
MEFEREDWEFIFICSFDCAFVWCERRVGGRLDGERKHDSHQRHDD